MNEIPHVQFVTAENLKTVEQYGAALLSSMISLRTLESFHIAAFEKGLLQEDEEECMKTMCWEIRRLMSLYKTQMENVLERCDLDQEKVISSLRMLMPDVKMPRKKKKQNNGDN